MEHSLCGIPFRLECRKEIVEGRVMGIFRSLFTFSAQATVDASSRDRGIEFQIGDAIDEPVSGEVVFDARELSAIRTERGYHLRSYESFFSIDLYIGRAVGRLTESFLDAPLCDQRGLLLFAVLLLLTSRGLYALHAGGVVSPEGKGVLLAGVSGSGKTTLSWALTRSGWSYLSDDSVLLKDAGKGVESVALGRRFHCAPAMFDHFSELNVEKNSQSTCKRLIEVETIYPERFRSIMQPEVILFPEIVRESQTRAIPLSSTETLVRLLQVGAAKLHDRAWMAAQMSVLGKLASTARGFRLLHGSDVHSNPAQVAALVQRLTHSKGECDELYSAA